MESITFSFIRGFLFALALCLDLGVVNVAMIRTGLVRGFAASLRIGVGSIFGDSFYLTLALLGWTAVFHHMAVQWVLWICGTLVLLWLTRNMIRDTVTPRKIEIGKSVGLKHEKWGNWADVITGAGLSISSPTLILSFIAIAGPVVADIHIQDNAVLISFIVGFLLAGLLWSIFISWLGSRAGKMGDRTHRILSALSALLFLGFAVNLFWSGLRKLIL